MGEMKTHYVDAVATRARVATEGWRHKPCRKNNGARRTYPSLSAPSHGSPRGRGIDVELEQFYDEENHFLARCNEHRAGGP
jgi:hypothetical protein